MMVLLRLAQCPVLVRISPLLNVMFELTRALQAESKAWQS
jgi:hypothetical protein